ncbi:DUF2125 domain-containing protein [Bartonella sp. CB175]|uniref:DUF2125 domain-containing protein n=1 Tax=Bartonella sp. CB175 TaxID=3112256 RepID=UPI00300DE9BA
MTVVCENIRKNGYPLRIGIICDKFRFAWPSYGFASFTRRLTVDAPVYTPHLLEINVHSPASIVLTGRTPLVLHWRNLVIKTEPYCKVDKELKLIAEGIEFSTISSPFFEDQIFQEELRSQITDNKKAAKQIEHDQSSLGDVNDTAISLDKRSEIKTAKAEFVRLNLKHEKNDLLGHIAFDSFFSSDIMAPYFVDFPKIDGNLNWVLSDVPHLFDTNDSGESFKQRLYGKSGILKRGELIFHTGGVLHISGPFSFDDEGYLTAKFELTFSQQADLLSTMQRLFPTQANNLQTLFLMWSFMPKNADGQPFLPLQITHGWIKLGFLKIGRLSPL